VYLQQYITGHHSQPNTAKKLLQNTFQNYHSINGHDLLPNLINEIQASKGMWSINGLTA
jgi:hypothetical protein